MKKFTATIFLLFVICFLLFVPKASADELSDLEKQISDLRRAFEMSRAATTPLEKNLDQLQANLTSIRKKTEVIAKDITVKENQVKEGEELLLLAEEMLGQKVRELYKSSSQFGAWGVFVILNNNLSSMLRRFGYQKAVISGDRDTIVKVVLYIKDIEQKKKTLEEEKVRLAKIKEETDIQAGFLEKEITGAKKY